MMSKLKKLIKTILILFIICVTYLFCVNIFVLSSNKNAIVSTNEITSNDYDCILILGAGVYGNTPSPLLKQRLDAGIELYKQGKAPKILMSGDHSDIYYDEVTTMKNYAIENGVPSEDIFLDHSGFSTYESVYRAKNIFKIDKMIIVTQRYHLYRALHLANTFDIEAIGIASNPTNLSGHLGREIREIFARNKDFLFSIFKPEVPNSDIEIDITGDGNSTNNR